MHENNRSSHTGNAQLVKGFYLTFEGLYRLLTAFKYILGPGGVSTAQSKL